MFGTYVNCKHLEKPRRSDQELHDDNIENLEKQFHANNVGPLENVFLSVRSSPLFSTQPAPCLWTEQQISATLLLQVQAEAAEFKHRFQTDVQFIFSRVQHHWHKLDDKGNRVPLKYCQIRGKKNAMCCKSGFPKKVLKHKNGKLRLEKYRTRIVCQGVAAELGLRTSGRRNALGSILGRRRDHWFSSTSALLACVARSNTNVQCNYRIPITTTTHDKDCRAPQCSKMLAARQVCLIAQRAMKQMTGYFGGYISKRQKMGKFEVKKSVAALPLMKAKLEQRNLKTASSQLAHVTNRMFSVAEGKGILRMCTEESMLSSQWKPHDPLAAEFIRTFRHQNFGGKWYLDRYDALSEKKSLLDIRFLLPRNADGEDVPDQVSLYGSTKHVLVICASR